MLLTTAFNHRAWAAKWQRQLKQQQLDNNTAYEKPSPNVIEIGSRNTSHDCLVFRFYMYCYFDLRGCDMQQNFGSVCCCLQHNLYIKKCICVYIQISDTCVVCRLVYAPVLSYFIYFVVVPLDLYRMLVYLFDR